MTSKQSDHQKLIKSRENSFRLIFLHKSGKLNEAAKEALAALRDVCFATKSTFNSDPLIMAKNEGRREVFNEIMNYLKVDYEDYYNLNEDINLYD